MTPPARPLGPRILFKDGPTGAYLYAAHFQDPAICRIIAVVAETAPLTRDNAVVITEGHRLARSGNLSLHPKLKALDVRTGIDDPLLTGSILVGSGGNGLEIRAMRDHRISVAQAWAGRIAMRLGTDCQVVFGDPQHINHMHIENDV